MRGATKCDRERDAQKEISIHAPLAGCDAAHSALLSLSITFQSTHPLRGATATVKACDSATVFQSTHPLRGATTTPKMIAYVTQISIHAPLAGCDYTSHSTMAHMREFQSTHPLRGATRHGDSLGQRHGISIHAPLAGCDTCPTGGTTRVTDISIHAPLAGCDSGWNHEGLQHPAHFNPRTPCGVRHESYCCRFSRCPKFQSTHPLRGATRTAPRNPLPCDNFNPRTPCGVRPGLGSERGSVCIFQSTHPLRGATVVSQATKQIARISIHAPLAGCDMRGFQCRKLERISIHAPLAGCDCRCPPPMGDAKFQSTHPLRGATISRWCCVRIMRISIHAPLAGCDRIASAGRSASGHFNPRTPCGVRQDESGYSRAGGWISIHAPLAGCDFSTAAVTQQPADFNPRTPCGVRHKGDKLQRGQADFNPRTPCGVRQQKRTKKTALF